MNNKPWIFLFLYSWFRELPELHIAFVIPLYCVRTWSCHRWKLVSSSGNSLFEMCCFYFPINNSCQTNALCIPWVQILRGLVGMTTTKIKRHPYLLLSCVHFCWSSGTGQLARVKLNGSCDDLAQFHVMRCDYFLVHCPLWRQSTVKLATWDSSVCVHVQSLPAK